MPPNDAMNDQELQLKKRARRRLVGAIALVLLMVIVLPWVLEDRSQSAPKEKIDVSIPSLDKLTSDTPVESGLSVVEATPEPLAPQDTRSDTVSTPANNAEVTAHAETQAQAQVSEPSAKPESSVKEPVTEKQDEKKTADVSGLHYYVQIGVFSDAENVKKMQGKLQELGYKALTEKVSTSKGEKIRLRTVVFNDRNEAAIALQNIKDAGLSGMVVSQK